MTSSNFENLWNVGRLSISSVVLRHYLNSQPPQDINLISFLVPTEGKADQPTHKTAISSERMIYIASGIAFILLLVLCFILGFWCYRRSHHKRIKRLFTVFTYYDET